ncbi:c-type cytochrome [Paracoccus sp. TK19116]|uniref:C-type cytochrome n=1 Tax=Paracoccus albicereus TaxID=2922394 RepID=A0ABT1MQ86_9RHOB|nr:c-type cytochrome [Paracoccus albicereus]MCQ0970469.1 c-type cytochrome [Paracoccus albicereus]
MIDPRRLIENLGLKGVRDLTILIVVLVLGFAGAVVGVGLYNVSARADHFPGVTWVLHTTFRNSVSLRADETPPDDLSTPGMISLGAGHYEQACAECHARPGGQQDATVEEMLPRPPKLFSTELSRWSASELHWIVYNGVKMSGMPGWPAERTDDVWPIVAFLRSAGEMTPENYAAATGGEERGRCAMCHGAEGVSTNPQIPRLDILSSEYVAQSLRAYREGGRDSAIMAQAARALDDQTIERLANSFDALGPSGSDGIVDAKQVLRGRALANAEGEGRTPSCSACHGPWQHRLNEAFPSLSGQHAPYLAAQLRLWRDGPRGGGQAAELMHHAAENLTDNEIAALASYYASRDPAPINP